MRFGEIAVEGGDGIESALARQVLHVDALIAPRQFVNPCARCLDAVHIDDIAEIPSLHFVQELRYVRADRA